MVEKQRSPLQRAAAYRWFSELSSAQRVEFLCGLLDLCQPLELRFLGCCLEDLARKDYHSLRDSEIRANNAADLARLTNLTDEVVRSRLLVSLALLTSENREAAGVLYRTLTHMDSIMNNYGLQLNEARTGDELLLLFTMASSHPAFSFHQRLELRQELAQLQEVVETNRDPPRAGGRSSPGCCKEPSRMESPKTSISNNLEKALHTPTHSIEEVFPKRNSSKNSKVHIEKIVPKGILPKKNEKAIHFSFEVWWCDSSVTSVTKSSTEMTEFIIKLSQLFPEEKLDKCIPYRSATDSFSPEMNNGDLKLDHRCLANLPSHMWKNDHVKKFFSTSSPVHHHQSPGPATGSHHKLNTTIGAAVRPICGVASIQSSQSITHYNTAPGVPVSPYSHSGNTVAPLPYRSQMDASSLLISSNLQNPQTQDQYEIKEWLKNLRLHKYYDVFSHLTFKEFLSLTEDDLGTFKSVTMGAKKKLKTQLELEKEKSEKQCINPMACTINSTVARVPPTSHVEPFQSIRFHHVPGLHMDIDQFSHQMHCEGSSSSEYSSSPSSPKVLQPREEIFDNSEETERHAPLESPEREKPIILMNHFASNSVRPTAQVLPVQNDAASNTSSQHPLQLMKPALLHASPLNIMNSTQKSGRGNSETKLHSSSVQSYFPLEDRGKASPGPRSSIKIEKSFGNMIMDMPTQTSPPVPVLPGVLENTGPTCVNFGMRTRAMRSSTLDRVIIPAQQQVVESSAAATMPSSTVFHVTRPSVKLLVSTAPSDTSVVKQTACTNMQSVSSALIKPRTSVYTANTKVAFSAVSSMPVAPIPGSFCSNSNAVSSNSHPATSFANVANLQSCPSPSSSPRLSPVCENNLYSSSGTAVNAKIPNQSLNHNHQHQPQTGCLVCSSCGCSGSCGTTGISVNCAHYFQHPFSTPSVFPFPFLSFNSLCGNSYMNAPPYNNSATFPMVHPPYNSSLNSADSVINGQSNFTIPPFQNFLNGAAGVYQPQGIMTNTNSTGLKKNGNLSCYNCGSSGHRAPDCKQPSMDFNQQGSFRLKYAPPSESLDSAE